MARGSTITLLAYAFYRVSMSGILSHRREEAPGASEQRTGVLVSDARTRQYTGRSIVPRLLIQWRALGPTQVEGT